MSEEIVVNAKEYVIENDWQKIACKKRFDVAKSSGPLNSKLVEGYVKVR